MIITAWEQWQSWAGAYPHLPFIRSVPLETDGLATWEPAWTDADPCSFVLESGKGGRYTMLGLRTASTIQGKGRRAWVTEFEPAEAGEARGRRRGGRVYEREGNPLDVVRAWLAPYRSPRVPGAPKFVGGCVGYWGYDVARSIERLPQLAHDDGKLPDYYWMRVDELWVVDREAQRLYCCAHMAVPPLDALDADSAGAALRRLYEQAAVCTERMAALWRALEAAAAQDDAQRRRQARYAEALADPAQLQVDVDAMSGNRRAFSRDAYIHAVREVQRYIGQGDVFQVNLSVRQERDLRSTPEDLYEWLRLVNPSPYMGLLRFPELAIVSGSPELLIRLVDGVVETRPIAGTRPRGADATEDLRLADELVANEKERAEHIMLVDLLRNDLGRISRYGTVRVDEFMAIEHYSHVMHIVSNVRGELAEGHDAFAAIAATFPGGTITGAPKVRTMEIIEELEPVRRGPYTGSIGWIDYNGNMELNIVIRTLVVRDGIGQVQAGAGIVIDSVPEREYIESLNKAKAVWRAIQFSESMMEQRS
ncbi:anthranilate synthase component I family protein [Paenibacillus sp. HJGM_3]|uniref:anthranilate synthase component I family protein n=1 Tax=Paenibacillus sp. HJGM_3 TaxID=3379816 RepID=UPI00385A36E1